MAFGSREASEQFCKHGNSVATNLGRPQIYLADYFLNDLKDLQASRSQALILESGLIHLRLAITICHELAHIMWLHRLKMDASVTNPSDCMPEPLHNHLDHSAELGHSFERHVFGGSIFSTIGAGLIVGYYTPPDASRTAVPAWYVNMWFRKALWQPEIFNRLFEQGELKLPNASESGYVILTQHEPPTEDIDFDIRMHEVFLWPQESHIHPNTITTRMSGGLGKQCEPYVGLLAAIVKQTNHEDRDGFAVYAATRKASGEEDYSLVLQSSRPVIIKEEEIEEGYEEQHRRLTFFRPG
jgi:hypothetical protein